jgi:hypothetical protein
LLLRLALRDLRHGDRQQLPLAQQLADVPRRVAFENAFAFPAAGLEGGVLERAHGGDL